MNFDDIAAYKLIDQSNFLQEIQNLDKKICTGWDFAESQILSNVENFNHIVFFGFQKHKSKLGLLTELCKPHLNVPITFIAEDCLPSWSNSNLTLFICLVSQKNAETIKSLFSPERCSSSIIILEIGNNFSFTTLNNLIGHWKLDKESFGRSSVGYDLMVLYGLLFKLNLVKDISNEVKEFQQLVGNTLAHLNISVPSSLNPAKRLAGQMVGRWIKIIGGGISKPMGDRWCEQINETAKNLAFSEDIHQLYYHSVNGIYFPENLIHQSMAIFLKSSINDGYIEELIDQLKEELMCNGLGTDYYSMRGETRFSQIFNTILFGDFVAYYLAIANQCDPYPTASEEF
jgi:glucose/mannose-6-phosphate isomerase